MKKQSLLFFFLTLIFFLGFAQSRALSDGSYPSISIYDWTNMDKFKSGPLPIVQGYGSLSDSLSQAYDGIIFYELEGEYFAIKHWGGYYYWFTQKYPELFAYPVLEYEYYWLIEDEIGMVRYISSCENYRVDFYPTIFSVEFEDASYCSQLKSDSRLATNKSRVERFQESMQKVIDNDQNRTVVKNASLSGNINEMRDFVRNSRLKEVSTPNPSANTGSIAPSRSIRSSNSKN